MLIIPAALIAEKNKLFQTGVCIDLLEVQLSEAGETLRMTSNNENVTWDGYTWQTWPFEPADVEETGESELPTFDIKISNVTRVIQGYVEDAANGLEGDTVIYRAVHSEHLDLDPYITQTFEILQVHCGTIWVTFRLGAENFYMQRFPGHIFKRDVCRYGQFKDDSCLYTGEATECNRSLATCISLGNEVRYGGQPGLPGGSFSTAISS